MSNPGFRPDDSIFLVCLNKANCFTQQVFSFYNARSLNSSSIGILSIIRVIIICIIIIISISSSSTPNLPNSSPVARIVSRIV